MRTRDAAKGKWKEILKRLGVDDAYLKGSHTPCPLCKQGKDCFRFDNKLGSGSYYCSKCGPGDGLKFAQTFLVRPFGEVADMVDQIAGNVQADDIGANRNNPRLRLRNIQKDMVPVSEGDPVDTYLNSRWLNRPTRGVYYHPSLSYYDAGQYAGQYHAMVSVFCNAMAQPVTVHSTYLTLDGKKAELSATRKIMPPIESMPGGSVALCHPGEIMGIAEGVETALAAMQLFRVRTWAALSANFMEKWIPPAPAKKIMVFGDHDASFTGQSAAYNLAARLKRQGLQVRVEIPRRPGDWNDVLMPDNRQIRE